MGRGLLIVGLVGLLMATGVAVASPADQVRHPVTRVVVDSEPDSVVVEPGDHLWKISERHLGSGVAVAPYWREVIEVNTPTLRSGDPNLIFPGELIEMPPVSGRP
jgi:nucleoid-associated protein YgaU